MNKLEQRQRRKKSIRKKIHGTAERPRVSVYRSNKHIYAQAIDDTTGRTLAFASDKKITKGDKSTKAKEVGKEIAKMLSSQKLETVVFDRNGFKYHGRLQALADGMREAGINL